MTRSLIHALLASSALTLASCAALPAAAQSNGYQTPTSKPQATDMILAKPANGGGIRTYYASDIAALAGGIVNSKYALSVAATTTFPSGVIRYDYAPGNHAPPIVYLPSAAPCSLYSGLGDGASQVPSSDGKCWLGQLGSTADVSEWGVATSASDNGPMLDKAMAWASSVGGAHLTIGAGTFTVGSTFDCHSANSLTLTGQGNGTVIYRTADYGDTMTCSNAQAINIERMWFLQYIGGDPTTSFINPTTNSAHFNYTNVSNFNFINVTAWNMNYQFKITQSIKGYWLNAYTQGYYDGTHNQGIADYIFDGADGTGLGHPQLMTIDVPYMGAYVKLNQTKTFTSGGNSRTVTTYAQALGSYDGIVVKSIEGLLIRGGISNDHYNSTLHIEPRGDTTRPILRIRSQGVWYDGAGSADVQIENSGANCSNPTYAAANDVLFASDLFNGELQALSAIYVQNASSCVAVTNLQISNPTVEAYVTTPFVLASVKGGSFVGASVRNYNAWGPYANDVANSSAAYISGLSSNFVFKNNSVGGGQNGEAIDLSHLPGTSPYAANQSEYGISIAGGLVNVVRDVPQNQGYYTDYSGSEPAVGSCGTGCVAVLGSDNRQGQITAGSGTVTSATVVFNGSLLNPTIVNCRVSDAVTSGGSPVAAAASSVTYAGFSATFASSIGGGSFRYACQ